MPMLIHGPGELYCINPRPPSYATCFWCMGAAKRSGPGGSQWECGKCTGTGLDHIPWAELFKDGRKKNESS